MTYVVTENCINCKFSDCVEVCPVDCFYEGENMLVINPDECIDCGACEPECPSEAIFEETECKDSKWLDINKEYSVKWPYIVNRKKPAADAEEWIDKPDKFQYFSPNPAARD